MSLSIEKKIKVNASKSNTDKYARQPSFFYVISSYFDGKMNAVQIIIIIIMTTTTTTQTQTHTKIPISSARA